MRWPLLLIAFVSFALGGCGGGGGSGSPATTPVPIVVTSTGDSVSADVGVAGGTLSASGSGLTLTIPEKSLAATTTISLAPSNALVPQGTIGGTVVEIGPTGTAFTVAAKLTIRYDKALLPVGIAEKDLTIAYLAVDKWQDVPTTVDSASKTLTASLSHFSTYALKAVDSTKQPYGTILGSFNGVVVHSNGCIDPSTKACGSHEDTYNSENANGYTTGLMWQCVEFVVRYYYQVYGMMIRIPGTNANDYVRTAQARGLMTYTNGSPVPPKMGDIIVSEGKAGNLGHVAIVRDVGQSEVVVVQQNWSETAGDMAHRLTLNRVGNGYVVGDFSSSYPTAAWLRSPSSIKNDTGIVACGSASGQVACTSSAAYPNQDALVGRDSLAKSGSLVKLGIGQSGFDHSKVAADGSILPNNATSWVCARDNVTGLVWEIKTHDGGLRDRNWLYSWYDTDDTRNGGVAGFLNPTPDSTYGKPFNPSTKTDTWCGSTLPNCNTQAYVQAVNATKLCGYADWRLPTLADSWEITDLSTNFSDYKGIGGVFIPNTNLAYQGTGLDPEYFVFTDALPHELYFRGRWTSTHDPQGSLSRGMAARVFLMSGGAYGASFKDDSLGIRLVRGGTVPSVGKLTGLTGWNNGDGQGCELSLPPTSPDERFQIGTDGTVLDIATNLVWKQCAEGQSGLNCSVGAPILYSSQDAQSAANSSHFAGVTGWRLPSTKELQSIFEQRCVYPALNLKAFPGMVGFNAALKAVASGEQHVWTSSFELDADHTLGSIFVSLNIAQVRNGSSDGQAYVRLVRDR